MMFDYTNLKQLSTTSNLVIVLAGGLGSLAVIRELGKHGVPVLVLASEQYLSKSKYCVGIKVLDDLEIVEILKKISKSVETKPVIFTDNERNLRLLYDNLEWLEKSYLVPLNSRNQQLTNKVKLFESAQNVGIKVPKVYLDLEDITDYPVIVKPKNEEAHTNPLINKAYECSNQEELRKLLQMLVSSNVETYVQEIIPGGMEELYSVTLYRNSKGQVQVGYSLRKLRQYPTDYGTGTCQVTCDEPKVIDYSIRLLNSVDYIGVAEIEYKYSRITDSFYIIEVNGRFPLHISTSVKVGNQFIFNIYKDLISTQGLELSTCISDGKEVIWTLFLKDVLTAKSKLRLISEYFRFIKKRQIQGALWDWSDLKPVVCFHKYLLEKLRSKYVLWRKT